MSSAGRDSKTRAESDWRLLCRVYAQAKPHRRLILGVLVVMAGKTVQVCQVVGWLPVHPIGELRLPYWAGLWFGVFPTWEGVAAQVGAAGFVLGSYAGAEWLRGRSRRAKLERLGAASTSGRLGSNTA